MAGQQCEGSRQSPAHNPIAWTKRSPRNQCIAFAAEVTREQFIHEGKGWLADPSYVAFSSHIGSLSSLAGLRSRLRRKFNFPYANPDPWNPM
jgi:hypothetical protein